MKKYFKSIGAALAYLALYLFMSLLVAIGVGLYLGFTTAFETSGARTDLLAARIDTFLQSNAPLIVILTNVLSLLSFLLVTKIRKKPLRERLDLVPVPLRNLWPLLVAGLTLNLLITFLIGFLPIPESTLEGYAQATGSLNEYTLQGFLAAVIVAPLFEEIMLRGYIMKTLQKGLPHLLAVFLQALIFGLLHGQILWVAYSFFMGILFGLLKLRYQSLYACILLHFSFNVSNYLISPLLQWAGDSLFFLLGIFIVSLGITILMVKLIMERTRPSKEPAKDLHEIPMES